MIKTSRFLFFALLASLREQCFFMIQTSLTPRRKVAKIAETMPSDVAADVRRLERREAPPISLVTSAATSAGEPYLPDSGIGGAGPVPPAPPFGRMLPANRSLQIRNAFLFCKL
jgi:hypothetical protein